MVNLAAATGCLAPGSASAAEVATHLFTGWYGIDAGQTVHKVNRANVDAESMKVIEAVMEHYHQTLAVADGDFAPERVNVPIGVKLRAEVSTKSDPWLLPDKPWETGSMTLNHVIFHDGLYRVWYGASAAVVGGHDTIRVLPNGRRKMGARVGETGGGGGLCYMESKDAVHWVKPSFGLVDFRGSKDNNIIPQVRGVQEIFLDPYAPAEERYKSVANVDKHDFDPNTKESGPVLAGAVSPDGIHWTSLPAPLWNHVFNGDGSPNVHIDPFTRKYVLYMRANYPRRRSISRSETSDFRHFPYPVIILTPGPDEDPSADYYDNPYLCYPGAPSSQLMLVSAFHRDIDVVDMQMATSMDGDAWNWLSPRAVVKLGKQGDWDGGMLWAMGDMVRLPDGRIAVGMIGDSVRHNESWRVRWESTYKNGKSLSAWAIWEDGRIAGVEAEKAGEFTTLALKATGQPIEINARTGSSGSVQVEVLIEEKGGPYPTLALKAREMIGDFSWRPLVFPEGSLTQLAGKNIRLRFHLYNAKVFGVRGEGLDWARSTRMSPPQL